MKFTAIRTRLLAWYMVVLSVGMVLFGSAIWVLMRYALLNSLDEALAARMESCILFLERESEGTDLDALREEAREYSTGLPLGQTLEVRDANGVLLYASPQHQKALANGNHRWKKVEAVVRQHPISVEMGVSLEEVQQTLRLLRVILTSAVPLVLIVATIGGWWISKRALQPVDSMTAAAEAISLRDVDRRLKVPRTGDELERLAEAWNRMLERIAASVHQITRFTTDAAHELRTPIAVIRSTTEVALRRERDSVYYREALSNIQKETIYFTQLIDELMWLVRTDEGSLNLNIEHVLMEELVSEVFGTVKPFAEGRNVALRMEYDGSRGQKVRCDRLAIRRVLLILLDNAIKFTAHGGNVQIRTLSQTERYRIEVRDNGEGVPKEHLPHIFNRFYRADKSRTSPGFGLGLSIAKAIVEAHRGVIGVVGENDGSCFYVELPAPPAS